MARNEAERRQRPPEGRSTSTNKGSRPQSHRPFASLFGPLSAASPKKRRLSEDQDRDRDRERDPAHGRSKDPDWGPDQDHRRDRKPRRSHHDHDGRGGDKPEKGHRHRHKHRPHSRERLLVEVSLKSVDDRYFDFKTSFTLGFPVSRVESYIRRKYEEQGRNIAPGAHFTFYSKGKPLRPQDEITGDTTPLWYSMSKNPGELEQWKFTHWHDETNGRLDSSLSDDLVKAIDEGATIGQLRTKVAEHMGVHDANRIVLTARGGTRRGLLHGNCWEARQIKKWLCRWISIDISQEDCYLVLRGLGREYLYHPPPSYLEKGMDLAEIQKYLRSRLFRAVRICGKSEFDLTWPNITLRRDGACLGSFTPVKWGATYTFELSDDAAETFADEETWLLAPTETCSVCMEDKRISELPVKVTPSCKHKTTICKDCLKQWLESGLDRTTWDRLKCPDCPELLQYPEVKRYATRETFVRYDTLATRAAAEGMTNFRWCLSPGCGFGQIEEEKCPKFKCAACSAKHCIQHGVLWHKGETCEEYDRRNKQRKKDDKASEQMIKKTSKKCPECKKDVHKYIGCNHITCVCGHEWCYICFAPFQRNEHGFLFCRHKPECSERDPFIDIIAPDQANGGPNGVRPPPMHPGGFPRPPPRFAPGFMPPHLRRQNANAAGGGGGGGPGGAGGAGGAGGGAGGPNNRRVPPPPPPGFPFPEPLDLNRIVGNRLQEQARAEGAALRMAAAVVAAQLNRAGRNGARQQNQDPAEGVPGFGNLHI